MVGNDEGWAVGLLVAPDTEGLRVGLALGMSVGPKGERTR